MRKFGVWHWMFGAIVGALTLLAPALHNGALARAGTFTVSRVHILLSAQATSETLKVQNTSDSTLRFQASVFGWDQDVHGAIVLSPTRDVVFFPPLFSLKPGEERNIRVGAVTPTAASEKTYRLFIEELPTHERTSTPPGQVAIRTRLGIPIFLRPPRERLAGQVDQVGIRDGRLAFAVRNTGSVHFVTQAVRLTGYGAAGETAFEGKVEGWYVLAGGTRLYDVELPSDKCPLLRAIAIEVQTPQATFAERVDLPIVGCRP